MARRERLLDMQRTERWTGSRALVALEPDICPVCGATLDAERVEQLPLLRHGGHGASRRTSTVACPGCTWSLVRAVDEVRPPR